MDRAELEQQLQAHHAASFAWALACCDRDRENAEDVLQTVYVKVLDGKARFEGRAAFRTWLFAVIRRTASSHRRTQWLRRLRFVSDEVDRADESESVDRGLVRFKVHQAWYESSVAALRELMDQADFDAAWAAGEALSTDEAIAYARRGRGERRRPNSGWAALTPAEHEVVRLVCDGLASKDIAARLFVSPRTVQAHLAHVYTKLGINSRVQLVQEASRRTADR